MTADPNAGDLDGEQAGAVAVALAYHRAWTGGDIDRAATHVAEDVVCDAPAGRLHGVQAWRGFMGPFAQTLRSTTLIAAFGDRRTALLMYDTQTGLVPHAPGAECLTVRDGRITHLRIVFDRLPFEVARRGGAVG